MKHIIMTLSLTLLLLFCCLTGCKSTEPSTEEESLLPQDVQQRILEENPFLADIEFQDWEVVGDEYVASFLSEGSGRWGGCVVFREIDGKLVYQSEERYRLSRTDGVEITQDIQMAEGPEKQDLYLCFGAVYDKNIRQVVLQYEGEDAPEIILLEEGQRSFIHPMWKPSGQNKPLPSVQGLSASGKVLFESGR